MEAAGNYFAAFLVALLGGVHCFGMCSGLVGALTLGLPNTLPNTDWKRSGAALPYILAYNSGRIFSYTVAGVLAGGSGSWAANLVSVHHAQQLLQFIAGLFMVSLGLYLANWWRGLARVEHAGGVLWRRVEPLGRRLLPIRTPPQALVMGMVWGWLPCGLVYSVVIWAISAGGALQGGLLMLSFGLGTLPTLLAMGFFAAALADFLRKSWVRRAAGALVVVFGVYQLMLALSR